MNQRFYISYILGAAAFGMFSFVESIVKNLKVEIKTNNDSELLVIWVLDTIRFSGMEIFMSSNRVHLALQTKKTGLVSIALAKITENLQNLLLLLWSETILPWSFTACLWEII